MTSNAPQSCCYQGVKHVGEASGEIKKIGDIETYFAYPKDKSTEKGLLIATDVIGHNFINVQLLADQFAANGYFVVMPDLFNGDAIPLNRPDGFVFVDWLQGNKEKGHSGHMPTSVDPIIDACLIEMRTTYQCKKIAAVGYCFGAKYVIRHLRPDQGKIDVGACAHPSFVTKEELEDIKGPFCIAAAETDEIFPAPKRHESEEILKAVGQPYQINLYHGVSHGFAVRGDPSIQAQRFAKESAFAMHLQFLEEYLK